MHAECAFGPGRVNLIGDHTDYNRGLALPMAIDLGTEVRFTPDGSSRFTIFSTAFTTGITLPVDIPLDPAVLEEVEPHWARSIAAIIAAVRPERGGLVHISSTLPMGSGLSSSSALAVALARVFGAEGSPRTISRLCQQAEELAGIPIGMMDPMASSGGRAGQALLIDFNTLDIDYVPLPDDIEVIVVDSGVHRSLRDTDYHARVVECTAAAVTVGPLGLADDADVIGLRDAQLSRRARHVVTECRRVRQVAEAFRADDPITAGELMVESHRSLAEDFEVSTPVLDALVADLVATPGVFGARLTGAGFGGCVVALAAPGAVDLDRFATPAYRVTAADGTAAREGGPDPEGTVPPTEDPTDELVDAPVDDPS